MSDDKTRAEWRREERAKRQTAIDAGMRATFDDLVDRSIQASADFEGVSYEEMDVITDAEMIVDLAENGDPTPAEILEAICSSIIELILPPDNANLLELATAAQVEAVAGDMSVLVEGLTTGAMARGVELMERAARDEPIPPVHVEYFYLARVIAGVSKSMDTP